MFKNIKEELLQRLIEDKDLEKKKEEKRKSIQAEENNKSKKDLKIKSLNNLRDIVNGIVVEKKVRDYKKIELMDIRKHRKDRKSNWIKDAQILLLLFGIFFVLIEALLFSGYKSMVKSDVENEITRSETRNLLKETGMFDEWRIELVKEKLRVIGEVESLNQVKEELAQQIEKESRENATTDLKTKMEDESRKAEENESREKAELESKKIVEEESRKKAERESKKKAEDESRKKAELESKKKVENESKKKVEAESKRKAEQASRKKAEKESKKKAAAKKKKAEEKKRAKKKKAKQKYVQPSLIYYWTDHGECYHLQSNCSYLLRANNINSGTTYPAGLRPCSRCVY